MTIPQQSEVIKRRRLYAHHLNQKSRFGSICAVSKWRAARQRRGPMDTDEITFPTGDVSTNAVEETDAIQY